SARVPVAPVLTPTPLISPPHAAKTARLKLAVRAERQNWRIPGVMALDSSIQLCELQGNFP
ncbi:hypothetical protein, partial [Xanthomonas euvesicatoria]|uniref:hypothetical protein n=1 Tax=Xanthomonas euvesicatoria TaxID=456327 RepID=UPI001F38784E